MLPVYMGDAPKSEPLGVVHKLKGRPHKQQGGWGEGNLPKAEGNGGLKANADVRKIVKLKLIY